MTDVPPQERKQDVAHRSGVIDEGPVTEAVEYVDLGAPEGFLLLSESALAYACISYAWGRDKVPSPLDARVLMSARTERVLKAAIGDCAPPAIWIDSFCMPVDEPARTSALRRMGAIYSGAAEVVVVLSSECSPMLEQIQRDNRVDETSLLAFEADDWVTRAWTYQEVVNSRKLRFTVEGRGTLSVAGSDLLNCVGGAIHDYKKAHGMDSALMRMEKPRLDALEDLLADWKIAGYLERSAYQVMAMMAGRRSERPEDYFYAMLGAISSTPFDNTDTTPADPAEDFMCACEAKHDFSFIYSTDPRSEEPARCWRPAPAALRALLPWHTWGSRAARHASPDARPARCALSCRPGRG